MRERWAIGTMTGTSLDALDVSLVRASGEGMALRVTTEAHATHDLGSLRPRLRAACEGAPASAGSLAALAREFGDLHATAARAIADGHRVDLAAIHGQTVFHAPPDSWQLVNPWPVAHALGCPVVSDLRGADLALGGQGAPITPLADWILLRHAEPTAVVNLGGFCNITWLPAEADGPSAIGGADICPCNHLLDAAARVALREPFDRDGRTALSGTPDAAAAHDLGALLERASRSGRSLGTGDEAVGWVTRQARMLAPDCLLATVATAIGTHVGRTAASRARRLVLAGGGARNGAVTAAIARAAPDAQTLASPSVGLPLEARESAEMAVLGLLAWDGHPITLPAVTHRRDGSMRDGLWCLPQR